MKIRVDYVTNSSSSSFVISKKYTTEKQLDAIRNHIELGKKLNMYSETEDTWDIQETNKYISGYTGADNFDMGQFLSTIGIPYNVVMWGEYIDTVDDSFDHYEENWEKELEKILNKYKET